MPWHLECMTVNYKFVFNEPNMVTVYMVILTESEGYSFARSAKLMLVNLITYSRTVFRRKKCAEHNLVSSFI